MKDRDVVWDFVENEKRSLYPVPCSLLEPLSDKELRQPAPVIDVDALAHLGGGAKHHNSEGGEVSLATC